MAEPHGLYNPPILCGVMLQNSNSAPVSDGTAAGSHRKKGDRSRSYRPEAARASALLEATATTARNARHWQYATDANVEEITCESERRRLRNRSRYEYLNNGYVKNAGRVLATHIVGTVGPQLTIKTANISEEAKEEIEWHWYWWTRQTRFVEKLRDVCKAMVYDGEIFLRFVYDPWVPAGAFNLQPISADRVTDEGMGSVVDPYRLDGIQYDRYGHPITYYVKRTYPNPSFISTVEPPEPVPAEDIIHIAELDLAEQTRGLPMVQCVLEHIAAMRRWEGYTLDAAEMAARVSGIIETGVSTGEDYDYEDDGAGFGEPAAHGMNLQPGEVLTLPEGTKFQQTDAKYPTSTYSDFVDAGLQKTGAGIGTPAAYLKEDCSNYNYSSWRGERQTYWQYIETIQTKLAETVLDVVLDRLIGYCSNLSPAIAEAFQSVEGQCYKIDRLWKFPKPESVDPLHDAQADEINLKNRTTSRSRIAARRGEELEEIDEELRRENEKSITDFMQDLCDFMGREKDSGNRSGSSGNGSNDADGSSTDGGPGETQQVKGQP